MLYGCSFTDLLLCRWCLDAYMNFFKDEEAREGERQGFARPSSEFYDSIGGTGAGMTVDRAFVIARHGEYGYLVLKAFKRRKGLHGQLPGGKVDATDASPAFGAARELFEETGIDLRDRLDRLKVATFPDGSKQLKGRQYFRLELNDEDSIGTKKPDNLPKSKFCLALSEEHVGYVFEKDPAKVSEWIAMHSGGKNQTAFLNLEIC